MVFCGFDLIKQVAMQASSPVNRSVESKSSAVLGPHRAQGYVDKCACVGFDGKR